MISIKNVRPGMKISFIPLAGSRFPRNYEVLGLPVIDAVLNKILVRMKESGPLSPVFINSFFPKEMVFVLA